MFHRKYRTIFFAIVLGLFFSHIPVNTDLVNLSILRTDNAQLSSEVWSDDFENETMTLDQWIFDGYNATYGGRLPANVNMSDGMLYLNGPITNYMFHNSTTTTGTWSLDVFLEYDFDIIVISFMSNYYMDPETIGGPFGYAVLLYPDGAIIHSTLAYWIPDVSGSMTDDIDTYSFNRTSGWIHIDITRQPDNYLYVYLNGTLRLQGMDTRWSTSDYFALETHTDSYFIFDNITVSDSVDIDKASPHWTEPLVDQSITEGEDFLYSLHADDYAGLDTWWVGDSTHFAIDQEGNLTSIGLLPAGNYNVEIFVNDTIGNVLSGTFGLEVIELPPTTTTSTPTATTSSTTTTNGTSLQLESIIILSISIGSLSVIVVMTVLIVRIKRNHI
ncbi:MAG: hypothetical protein ACTSU3_11130 [Candidatus Thorarchaeota archaeon]